MALQVMMDDKKNCHHFSSLSDFTFIHSSVRLFCKKGVIFGEKIQLRKFREITIFAPKSKNSKIVIFTVSEK